MESSGTPVIAHAGLTWRSASSLVSSDRQSRLSLMYRAHQRRALDDLCPIDEVATTIRQLHRRYLLCSVRQVQRFVYSVFNLGCVTIAWFVVIAVAISRAGASSNRSYELATFVSSVLTFELGCCPWTHEVVDSAGHRPWSTGHIGHVRGKAPAFYSCCRKLVFN